MLQGAGYTTAAIVANAWVSDERGYAQGFDRFLTRNHLDAEGMTALATRLADRLLDSGEPFLLYVHYMDPHAPYDPSPEALDAVHPQRAQRRAPETPLERLVETFATYDAEVFELDLGVGRLLDHLRERGALDELLVAFTSDHGEQFYEHGELGHGRGLHDEEVRVPLVLRGPGLAGRVARPVSTLALGPTLLDYVGAPALPDAQAASLLAKGESEAGGVLTEATMYTDQMAWVDDERRKFIAHVANDGDTPRVREVVGVFDLANDPRERAAIAPDDGLRAAFERELLATHARSLAHQRTLGRARVELDAETVEALRALGYTGEDAPGD